jgi:hypothetical protein
VRNGDRQAEREVQWSWWGGGLCWGRGSTETVTKKQKERHTDTLAKTERRRPGEGGRKERVRKERERHRGLWDKVALGQPPLLLLLLPAFFPARAPAAPQHPSPHPRGSCAG